MSVALVETWLPRHLFNVDEYERMREFGVLRSSDRVELLEGLIVDSTDRIPEGGRLPRESRAMDAVPDSWIPFHRFTVDEYYRMAQIGVLAEDARVELIEGEIIDMAPIGSWHCGTVGWLTELFMLGVRQHTNVWTQGVVRLSPFSEPQPDVMLLKRREDFYRHAHPGAAETLLVVEVSDSSLRSDQMVKIPLFAHFGVPEVWIVDGVHETVHFYRAPSGGEYTEVSSTDQPGVVALASLPDVKVDLTDLFG
jgi:Uma2 family endonuclease